ncbi:MAG: DMT family transporter [Deltaproteobacteria bacterium]|uniref:DMT family transporter n=1 Tax=Candidatus Zymogenus saltonus TaxID=2844893 RepID=A0A9D8KH92_9DELT|nr:DMT family transporter [Candidatus Zymogenus saltonus]
MGIKEWGLILILSVIWGGSFFFIGVSVREITPLTVVMFRVTIAAAVLLIVVRVKKERMPTSPGILGGFFIMGALFNVIPFSLIVWGQTHIESGFASILNATTPIFSVILAHFLTREERLTANRVTGVLIGWLGVTILIGIESLKGFGIEVIGQIAVLGASLSYAFGAIYGVRFKNMSTSVVAAGMVCSSSFMITPLALFIEKPWHLSPGVLTILALFGLAVICTSLAYLIYFRILAVSGPTNSLLVTFLVPINAILLGYLFLGERLGWNAFAGMGTIFLGLAAIDGRLIKTFKRKEKG